MISSSARSISVRAGLYLLLPMLIFIFVGPYLLPDPLVIDVKGALQEPSNKHLLGTDALGRDLLARLAYGGRYSLAISFTALAGSLLIGLVLGFFAGWFGGLVDGFLEWFLQTIMCVPGIMLALVLVLFFGQGILGLTIALTITGAIYIARLARAEIHLLKSSGFIEVARLYGMPWYRIFYIHLLPNIMGPILAYCVILLGTNILGETALSFLGVGIQPPEPSWGAMLFESRNFLLSHPLLALAPGIAIFLTVLGFNLVAEGLRQGLGPVNRNSKTFDINEG